MKYYTIYAWGECPFCVRAKALLIEKRHMVQYVVLDHASDLLKKYKSIYNMKTVPIIVYKDGDLNIEKSGCIGRNAPTFMLIPCNL